jgi:hypothetical protein
LSCGLAVDPGVHVAFFPAEVRAYTLTLAGLLLMASALHDKYGRKWIFLTGRSRAPAPPCWWLS